MSQVRITSMDPDAVVRAFIDMNGYRVVKPIHPFWLFWNSMVVQKDRRTTDDRRKQTPPTERAE